VPACTAGQAQQQQQRRQQQQQQHHWQRSLLQQQQGWLTAQCSSRHWLGWLTAQLPLLQQHLLAHQAGAAAAAAVPLMTP
jgi:hypothetical protein